MTIAGVNPQAAIEAIKARAGRSPDGRSPDGRKIALVVEGGAMRGIRSAGGVLALEALGLSGAFDEVYGTSAGAVNASYFLSGQAAYGTTIYYQDINNATFINRLRVGKIVDLDYLFDDVMVCRKPLDVQKVLRSPSRFYVSLTDVDAGEGRLVVPTETKTPLRTLLKASSAMPIVYNHPVLVDGRRCIDGGVANAIPLAQALANGCTDVLVLLTRPASYRNPDPGWIERRMFAATCGRGKDQLRAVHLSGDSYANQMRDLALGRVRPPGPTNIATIAPAEGDAPVDRMTRDARLLKAAAVQFAQATWRAFGKAYEQAIEVLQPFDLPRRSDTAIDAGGTGAQTPNLIS